MMRDSNIVAQIEVNQRQVWHRMIEMIYIPQQFTKYT